MIFKATTDYLIIKIFIIILTPTNIKYFIM